MENKQKICDLMCAAIRETLAGGTGNALAELRYDPDTERVRPIFEDGTGADGYYDINVACDSGIAVIMDIVRQFVREVW